MGGGWQVWRRGAFGRETDDIDRQDAQTRALPIEFDPMVKIELEVIIEEMRSLNQRIAKLEKTITEEGSRLEGHKNLTSIKEIGPLTGSILLSVIGDIHDFADESQLAAYFKIVPQVSKSNETEDSGRITKRGSKLGRTELVQCGLIAQRYSPYLKQFYERIKATKGAGKAIIALARKLLGIIYGTLKNKWVFEDFPNFVLAEAIGCGPPVFPCRLCSRAVLAVQGSLGRAYTARPGPLGSVPNAYPSPGKAGKSKPLSVCGLVRPPVGRTRAA